MDISSRSRSPHRSVSAQTHCWVKVKNGKSAIRIFFGEIEEPRDVTNFVEAVKTKVKPRLDSVPSDILSLFQSENAMKAGKDALQPDAMVGKLSGTDAKNPFFLSFPDASFEATPSQALRGGMKPVAMTPQIPRDTTTSKSFGASHSVHLQKHRLIATFSLI